MISTAYPLSVREAAGLSVNFPAGQLHRRQSGADQAWRAASSKRTCWRSRMEKNSMKWKLSILISKGGHDDALVG